MALQISSGFFAAAAPFSPRRVQRIRAVASTETEEGMAKLGGSELKVTKLGIGAWSWGDTSYWNNFEWDDRKMKAAKAAFDTSIDCGITLFDTAEVYGSRLSFGAINSETLLGRFIKERKERDPGVEVAVATKFAALPWRLGRRSVITALKDSLCRLGLSSVDLYQLHWFRRGLVDKHFAGYLDGLGDAVEQGLVKAVGVSNYSEKRLRDAYEQLKKRGIPLASNQVNYSLIYRLPEENGVKAACDELGITLIAYSPIAQGEIAIVVCKEGDRKEMQECYRRLSAESSEFLRGRVVERPSKMTMLGEGAKWVGRLHPPSKYMFSVVQLVVFYVGALTGKYTPQNPPTGPRGNIYTPEFLTLLQPLINRIKEIGEKYGKTPTQVVLNWLIAQENVIPIPGAKNAEQAKEFAGALSWRLAGEEIAELRSLASEIKPVVGFPVEKL
ncbi:hypothetical protein RHSIM_Rhsim06G0137600 [Rhododendron simsii]|uniref:NADP-dependent oxidoreductase domain-containing protein n=1 Tax=Rhododendron simsii TaxID=118357 RepID=A0A834LKQ6_RHOSS|nr:hypothetical protein RHSIM_Rhsim06G0137600 [Rhododendron simsii]